MKVFLTSATGYLGSAVLARLRHDGHAVTAHVRSRESADCWPDGVTAAVGEPSDAAWLTDQLDRVDGVIHTASPNDETSKRVDTAFLNAVLPVLAGTDRPLVHTGGTWIHGSGPAITETTPPHPPPIVAWRPAVLTRVREAAAQGIRTIVISPANLYGDGGGIPAMLAHGPTTDSPDAALLMVGGDQHFPNVHRADIAALNALALTEAPAGSYFLAANADSPTMTELMQTASRARGLDGRTEREPTERSRDRLGPLVDAVLLDAQIDCAAARDLGRAPVARPLIDELDPTGDA
jgi:nucleoside-diphosphate-sugar epimerase